MVDGYMNQSDYIKSIKSRWSGHHDFAVWLVKEMKPRITVDLGIYHGFSTFSFALPGLGEVYGIDNFIVLSVQPEIK